jgi:hypothetical protein
MILYLRNKENHTIVDVEIFIDKNEINGKFVELHSRVIIDTYSELFSELLKNKNHKENIDVFISDFNNISELRGWLWESYFIDDNDPEKLKDVIEEVSTYLKGIGKKYDLNFITD